MLFVSVERFLASETNEPIAHRTASITLSSPIAWNLIGSGLTTILEPEQFGVPE
jgi:hypothetical protein